MRRPRILNAEAEAYAPEALAALEEVAEVEAGQLDREALLARLPDADALIVRLGHRVDAELLAHGPHLRAVATATTGLDHIDLEAAAARHIEVLSLRGEVEFLDGIHATAEHTWALLLALVRQVPAAIDDVRAGHWRRDLFRGRGLDGRTLGIAGFGRVGRQVAGYGSAFGMRVIAWDPGPLRWVAGVERAASLDELLAQAEVLSLHASLGDGAHGMIGARELALLPAGAVLVNTARGALVDEAALAAALRSGRLAGAALDVVEHERDPERRLAGPLARYLAGRPESVRRLLITPHLGGATVDAMARTEVFMARKLASFLANLRPLPEDGP
jgi:D-3-phosphoglycerate dehydrogenase